MTFDYILLSVFTANDVCLYVAREAQGLLVHQEALDHQGGVYKEIRYPMVLYLCLLHEF